MLTRSYFLPLTGICPKVPNIHINKSIHETMSDGIHHRNLHSKHHGFSFQQAGRAKQSWSEGRPQDRLQKADKGNTEHLSVPPVHEQTLLQSLDLTEAKYEIFTRL